MPATDTDKTRRATTRRTAARTDPKAAATAQTTDDAQQQTAAAPTDAAAVQQSEQPQPAPADASEKQDEKQPPTGGDAADQQGEAPQPNEPAPPAAVVTALESMQADRDRLAETIGRRREEFEASISAEVVQLAELEGYIRVIERQQHGGSGASGNGGGARGRNREKIMPLLAGGKRLTTREISDTTGIGRGSVDRTMHHLAEQGVVNKTDSGWGEVPAATPKS